LTISFVKKIDFFSFYVAQASKQTNDNWLKHVKQLSFLCQTLCLNYWLVGRSLAVCTTCGRNWSPQWSIRMMKGLLHVLLRWCNLRE